MIEATALRGAVAEIVNDVQQRVSVSRVAKEQWREELLWRELSCCVLSSQVRYSDAYAFASIINDEQILAKGGDCELSALRTSIHSVLSRHTEIDGKWRRYRFSGVRSAQLAETHITVMREFGSLKNLVELPPTEVRQIMINRLPGVGPKQSSMFLRNIGATYDLAVIDRHVVKYMVLARLDGCSGKPPQTMRQYVGQEAILQDYSRSLGYPVGILDWAIWIVMRAAGSLGLA